MGISIMIVAISLFLIFMSTVEGVEESARGVVFGIGAIVIIYILYRVIRG